MAVSSKDMEIGRKCFKVADIVYNVGDIIKGMRFYVSENEYHEVDVKLVSTNVRKKAARFKGVGKMNYVNYKE